MDIGERIKQVRGELSRQEFGSRIGVGKTTVQNYETKDHVPKGVVLQKISDEFNINISWLLTGQGEPYHKEKDDDAALAFLHNFIKAEDKGGLWGRTRRSQIAGNEIDVTAYGDDVQDPALVDAFSKAVGGLQEIFYSRDPILIPAIEANIRAYRLSVRRERQVAQQAREIEKLKKECGELKDRIAGLEEKISDHEDKHKKGEAA